MAEVCMFDLQRLTFSIEQWGLIISVVGLAPAIGQLLFPPVSVKARVMHGIYAFLMLVICLIFTAIIQGDRKTLTQFQAQLENRNRIAAQAEKMYNSLPFSIDSTNCGGVVMSAFSFIGKFQEQLPGIFDLANQFATRSVQPRRREASGVSSFEQQEDCRYSAESMRQLVRGISTM
jgi:hypothetical protein